MRPLPVLMATAIAGLFVGLALHATLAAGPMPPAGDRPAALPAPHLGYGVNLRRNLDLAGPLGFDWIKIYEDQLAGLPTGPFTYHVLLRIAADGYPASMAAYLQHVTAIVSDNLHRIDAVEIGNEPNTTLSWGQQAVSPENYARLLCQTRSALKAIAPGLVVVSAGLAPVGRTPVSAWGSAMDDRVFAERLLNTMQTEYPAQYPCFDAFGYHAQGYPYEPERAVQDLPPGDNGNEFHFRATEWYHTLLVNRGFGGLPIWLTEFGWLRDPDADPWWADNTHTTYGFCSLVPEFNASFGWMKVSAAQQADYLVRAFQYADANWPWLGPMFIWNLDWNNQGWDCDHIKFFSILHASSQADGQPHAHDPAPAYAALAAMTKRFVAGAPELAVQPAGLWLLTEVNTPTIQTRTLQIDNVTPNSTLTWTISADPTGLLAPVVSPVSGTNTATVTVAVDTAPITTPGVYTAGLIISAEPISTVNAPLTVPVTIIAPAHLNRLYFPVVARNYAAPHAPVAATLQLGLAFVSSAQAPASETRYQRALAISGTLNRWPMYWPSIELNPVSQPRVFNWTAHDANIIADLNHGLTVLPILMLTPIGLDTGGSRAAPAPRVGDGLKLLMNPPSPDRPLTPSSQGSPPQGLDQPVFSDDTDLPGAGKTINPNNRWAYFVNAAINRYKPGGVLAQTQGWGADKGVRYWEIWNEQDLDQFFIGTPADYARLLKVAYLAGKQADPNATIVFGGLAHFEKPNWLQDTLNVIATDPMSITYHGFMDAVASHNYAWAWQTYGYLLNDRQRLDARGLTGVKLWITETGLPVCDDSPIEPFNFCPSPYRGTLNEQVDFLIQTAAWSAWMQAEKMIWFQLYDDVGNVCPYDFFGLVRNPATSPCVPNTGLPRPAYAAYPLAAQLFGGVQPYWRDRRTGTTTNWASGNQEIVAFKRPATGQRVVTMWTRYYTADTVILTATSSSALLIRPDGTSQTITPVNGVYTINLPAATNLGAATPDGKQPDGTSSIGGSPRILVELDPAVAP